MDNGQKEDTIQKLNDELTSIKKSFEVLLLAIEAEGVAAAADVAERLMARVEKLMNDIKMAYVDVIFEKRFRSFTEDRARLQEMKASGRPSTDTFIEMVGRIEQHIAGADRELRLLVPRKPQLFIWVAANWRRVAIGAAAALVAWGVATFVRNFATRGTGLIGEYYEGASFRKLVRHRRDLRIDFDLNGRSPVHGLGNDNYSVRWTGSLRVPADGEYEFVTRSDDGVRLWIDNEMLIDNWTVHRAAVDKSTKMLTAGMHAIKLEWFQRRGPALMKLYWRMANDAQPRIIDPEYLSPNS